MTALILLGAMVGVVYVLARVTRRRPLAMSRAWMRAYWIDEESND